MKWSEFRDTANGLAQGSTEGDWRSAGSLRVSQRSALSAVLEADAVVVDFQALLAAASTASIVEGARRHLQAIGRIPRTP
jgi:hypothetical protein